MSHNPFLIETTKPLVVICGERCGYVQLASSNGATDYASLPDSLFLAAKSWAAELEALGAKRVYWITLSEVVRQLHIHLYPRWTDDEPRGLPLFDQRDHSPQPIWDAEVKRALQAWAEAYQVHRVGLV
jgi:diadenosine tetraphosphate (Ap4A) HIT family hydrolase